MTLSCRSASLCTPLPGPLPSTGPGLRERHRRSSAGCRRLPASAVTRAPWRPAPLPLDGDHGNRQAANLATACLHCRAMHRLGSDQIDRERVDLAARRQPSRTQLARPRRAWRVCRARRGSLPRQPARHRHAPVARGLPHLSSPRSPLPRRGEADRHKFSPRARGRVAQYAGAPASSAGRATPAAPGPAPRCRPRRLPGPPRGRLELPA